MAVAMTIHQRIGKRDMQMAAIYGAIENLRKAGQRKWDERERIGFRK